MLLCVHNTCGVLLCVHNTCGVLLCAPYMWCAVMCAPYMWCAVMCAQYMWCAVMCVPYMWCAVMCTQYMWCAVMCAQYMWYGFSVQVGASSVLLMYLHACTCRLLTPKDTLCSRRMTLRMGSSPSLPKITRCSTFASYPLHKVTLDCVVFGRH